MLTTIGKRFTFEAAHNLPEHEGKCRNVHGHSYVVEVVVSGLVQPEETGSSSGMVLDFGVLSAIWKRYIEPLVDHQYLNDVLPAGFRPPTAEYIAQWIGFQFETSLKSDLQITVESVTVWETATSFAKVYLV